MSLTKVSDMADELKAIHRSGWRFGDKTAFDLVIEIMLEEEDGDFCLAIAEMALAKARTKGLFVAKGVEQASRKVWWTEYGANNG